jgi:tetratricopeptide (TPR) repeat protein
MAGAGRFSQLLLEGLDHYRKGRMLEAVRVWEEAYLLEPTNLRAREFLRSALERIHAHMGGAAGASAAGAPTAAAAAAKPHPWLPPTPPVQGATDVRAKGAPAQRGMPPPPLPGGPWDDGPSVAIPQQSEGFAGDEVSGAWKIHKEPLPNSAVADDEVSVWMRGARELVALNDFSGALELLGKILERKPQDADALAMLTTCEHNLTQMFESKIGAMDAKPKIAIPPDEIIWLNLDPRAGFVLAQIDGEVSFDDLYAICGLKRLDTARILSELLEQGVVKVDGQDRAVAKRTLHR